MNERAGNMHVKLAGENDSRATSSQGPMGVASPDELHALNSEIVALLYEQAFAADGGLTEAEICESFSRILLRHWNLCCIITYLRGADGRLRESANHFHQHIGADAARRIAALMAGRVESGGSEYFYWPDEEGEGSGANAAELQDAFEAAGLKAGVAIPIHTNGVLSGAVVVVTTNPERLRHALDGIRCLGPAIVIAIGNARRSETMSEQHRRIETLVEELRSRTAALEEANRELHRVSRYRSLFLARMSHELRTPLTSVLGFVEILLDQEDLTAAQRRFCEKIQSSGFQLQSSLNHLVDLSRLEAGKTDLFLHEFSLRETLRESCAAVARLAQKNGVTLDCQSSSNAVPIVSDEGKLRQVLFNFLAHAIGRSPEGGRVAVSADSHGGRLIIEIADEGEPLTDPAHLFEPVDVDAPNERGTNMNELGLVIAHRLLVVLGGKVTLDHPEPKGLTVRLNLPARPTEQDAEGVARVSN